MADRETKRVPEQVILTPENLEVMWKFATTVIVVPTTGVPAALVHFGISPINDFDDESIHNIAISKEQLDLVMEDMQRVKTMLDNM